MRVGSLFTGIGGLDLGLPGEHAWLCEYDQHARRVLEQRFPGVPVYPDVRELDDTLPPVDMLIGGYPCQPFSVAGKRAGADDPRHLWPEFLRLIRVLRPRYVFAENVSGHLALGFDRVLCDLAEAGFDAEWVVVRASDVGAPHRRERLFVLARDSAAVGRDGWADDEGVAAFGGDGVAVAGEGAAADAGGTGARRHAGATPRAEEPHRRREPNGSHSSFAGGAATADADVGRREQHLASIRDVRLTREDGLQPAADGDGEGRCGIAGVPPRRDEIHAHERVDTDERSGTGWGAYEPAIRRWEHALGRPAPRSTDDRGRLMPAFVEWMMGVPAGWVSDTDTSRTQQLRMLGNAVVPQQAALAWQILTAQASA